MIYWNYVKIYKSLIISEVWNLGMGAWLSQQLRCLSYQLSMHHRICETLRCMPGRCMGLKFGRYDLLKLCKFTFISEVWHVGIDAWLSQRLCCLSYQLSMHHRICETLRCMFGRCMCLRLSLHDLLKLRKNLQISYYFWSLEPRHGRLAVTAVALSVIPALYAP